MSLRSGATIEALARQQGRYTLAILDAEPDYRTIQAHRAWHGPGEERRFAPVSPTRRSGWFPAR